MADRRSLIQQSGDALDSDSTRQTTPALPSLGFAPPSTSPPSSPYGGYPDVYVSPPSSPWSPSLPRPGHQRRLSAAEGVVRYGDERSHARTVSGLGIGGTPTLPEAQSVPIQTIPPASIMQSPPIGSDVSPLASGNPLFGGFPRDSPESTPDLRRARFSPDVDRGHSDSYQGQSAGDYHDYLHTSSAERLHRPSHTSLRSAYRDDFRPTEECPTARDIHMSRWSWVSVTLVLGCLLSTVLSGIFVGLAIRAPRYGRAISSQGKFKPADAILVTSIVAKLIELTFVTSFVAFLGQVLSRRAFMKKQGRGVTLSEMSMWRWVVQPGTLVTHWETAKYAGVTVLGALSLLSAILATLYTPASSAVVQPSLKEGRWGDKIIQGSVMSDFANVLHVSKLCSTPIRTDSEAGKSTCLQIEHAGQAYHNYQRYLATWETAVLSNGTTTEQRQRPQAFGLLHENTTVTGQWIEVIDTKAVSRHYGRSINNVSLAMPHSGVFQAARDQRNGIMQPEELDSEGSYTLRASVPSPAINVLCAGMTAEELAPIVYQEWHREGSVTVNGTTWMKQKAFATTKNDTVVDDIFGWTKQNDAGIDYPPVFPRLPLPFNTVLNHTSAAWGRDSIYLLGQGGKDDGNDNTGSFVLCRMKMFLTPKCSTHYTATGSGGSMRAHCEDEDDEMAYWKSFPEAPDVPVSNWRDVAFDWSNSLSFNTGIDDANASNSRLLTQLILRPNSLDTRDDDDEDEDEKANKEVSEGDKDEREVNVDLNPVLPSTSEALAVLSGSTLLISMMGTSYVHFWNFTQSETVQGQLQMHAWQPFNASLRSQQYASGGENGSWRGFWIAILIAVFLINVGVLAYLVCHNGMVTDFSEPPNLFALAVNSPPSRVLEGSCGGGPNAEQFKVGWFVGVEGGHLFMEPKAGAGEKEMGVAHGHGHWHEHGHGNGNHVHVHGNAARGKEQKKLLSGLRASYQKLRGSGFSFGSKSQSFAPVGATDTSATVSTAWGTTNNGPPVGIGGGTTIGSHLGWEPSRGSPALGTVNEMHEVRNSNPGLSYAGRGMGNEGSGSGLVEVEDGHADGGRRSRTRNMYERLAESRSVL